eukprot:sb/3465460/
MIQGGDFLNNDGTGSLSIYGRQFDNESFENKHTGPGILSMANSGPDTNGCQFFITCSKCDFLDNKHVAFGKVIDGMLVVRKVENVPVGPNNRPKFPVIIDQCGEIFTYLRSLTRAGSSPIFLGGAVAEGLCFLSFLTVFYSMSGQIGQNPVVFFDISIGGHAAGRIKMELFADSVPKTSENFRQLCTGEFKRDSVPTGFKGCQFHRVIKDFMIQGGDFLNNDGTGSLSIYGRQFDNESFENKHTGPGILSMANSGPDTNGCQFFITCSKCDFLDNKHVAFGKVIDGMLVVRKVENVPVGPNNRPKFPVIIDQCGEIFTYLRSLTRAGSSPIFLGGAVAEGHFSPIVAFATGAPEGRVGRSVQGGLGGKAPQPGSRGGCPWWGNRGRSPRKFFN